MFFTSRSSSLPKKAQPPKLINIRRSANSMPLLNEVNKLLGPVPDNASQKYITGLEYLNKQDPKLFDAATAKFQFAPGLGYQARYRDAGGSVVITDLETAKEAIKYIVDQGEGYDDGNEFADQDKLEKSHFYVFKDLYDQINSDPTSWETYPVRKNPNTIDYHDEDRKIYHVCWFHYFYSLGLLTCCADDSRCPSHSMRRTASC